MIYALPCVAAGVVAMVDVVLAIRGRLRGGDARLAMGAVPVKVKVIVER